jgi:hypothetical protein
MRIMRTNAVRLTKGRVMAEELETSATTVVLAHVLISDLGVIGAAARTLGESWDQLPPLARARILDMIYDTVDGGIERLRLLMLGTVEADSAT